MGQVIQDGRGGRGAFIVLEGLDGAGTTTQGALLAAFLTERGANVELTREPSTGPLGGLIRSTLEGRMVLDASSLALLFAADRADHLYNKVNGVVGMLESGMTVISDRYVLSSLAYQASQGLSIDWLLGINARAIVPDVTIFVDTDVDECLARIGRRSSREELFNEREELRTIESFYRRVLSRGEFIGDLVTADGNQDPDLVAKQVRDGLADLVAAGQSPAARALPELF
jgi:dTMP kinase